MSYPTGMGPATGVHFYNVAAQMQAHVNHGGAQNLRTAHGQFHQHPPTFGPAYASQIFPTGTGQLGYPPVIDDQYGAAGRNLLRSLF